ncbi:hypothetical protein SCHPADRAFT_907374, partial [Schizopora paradoxa]
CSNTTTTTARHRLPRSSAFDIYLHRDRRSNRIHGALHTHPGHQYAILDRIGAQEGRGFG